MGRLWLTRVVGVVCALFTACVSPTITKCPDVDCPKDMVCDGQGGCALPDQLTACSNHSEGDLCSYVNKTGGSVEGTCAHGICLPVGCGNFIRTPNEVCDDGNTINGDGCSADCQSDETCPNGVVDPAKGEQCDDGNTVDGDGCQHDCKNPRCGDGVMDSSLNEQCDNGTANSDAPDAMCRPNCQTPRCGDGVRDPGRGEVCDDGNNTPGDGCSADCESNETCGNNVIDALAGEVCDDGNTVSNDGCAANCRSIESCGNGVVDTARGEVCDDGNIVSGDGCSSDCRSLEVCGNNIVDTINEQCDLGTSNSTAPDAMCRPTCKFPACGDGIKDPLHNEQCDTGTMNSNTADACRTNCQLPRCGDTIKDTGEICDDGNYSSGDGCSGDCKSNETCGNGYIDTAKGEQCDAGASNSDLANAPCRSNCTLPRCGDGAIDTTRGESCDAGAANSNLPNATCRTNCQPQRCGDLVIDNTKGEVCDDGNTAAGDGCSPDCQSNETCGNGVVDVSKGEQCDAGGLNADTANAPCRTTCKLPRCGDAITDTALGESCDLGASNSNLANATCRTNCQPQRCGDNILDNTKGEVCDDGNTLANDGCSPDCKSNETCGNGIIDVSKGEQCDAGTNNSDLANAPCRTNCQLPKCGDGAIDTTRGEVCDAGAANSDLANATCRTNCQPQRCGDNIFDNLKGEVCDDGNVVSGDNCSGDCKSLETCPNGIVDTAKGEQCDDGNAVNTDYCHNNCTLPRCGDGIVDFNEQCDAGTSNADTPNAPCRTTCQLPRCGDMIVDTLTEVCDDGNLNTGDGCTPDCKSNETCGNGVLDFAVGEECDDGNVRGRDGCSTCKFEDAVIMSPGHDHTDSTRHTMAYDAGRQRVVLFDGESLETWEWDGISWTHMRPRNQPSPRHGQVMIYEPNLKRVILFGGHYGGYRNDTWSWDGNDWTQIVTANAPEGREYFAWSYDPLRKTSIIYGGTGASGTTTVTDMWEFTGTDWQKLTFTGVPGARSGHRLIWDAARQNHVLFGGTIDGQHTWTLNSTTLAFTDKGTNTSIGVGRMNAMAYDPTRQVIVYWRDNNITWEWNGTAWTSISGATPLAPSGFAYAYLNDTFMVYDVARGHLVLSGGTGPDTQATPVTAMITDTWRRIGTTWSVAPPFVTPGVRYRTNATYDPVRGKVVIFGGGIAWGIGSTPFPNVVNDTWEWDGRQWAQVTTTAAPTPRQRSFMDFNPSTKQLMLFGGNSYNGTTHTLYADLYSYNSTTPTWNTENPVTARTGLKLSAMAYDANANKVVTFGGRNASDATLQDTWTWTSGTGWTLLNPSTKPPGRRGHALAYDPLRKRVVLFGGRNAASEPLADVWEWDGSNWTPSTATGPTGRDAFSLFFNGDRGQIELFGNAFQNGREDLWDWSGTKWSETQIDPIYTQYPNYAGGVAYDAKNHQIVYYGGRSNTSATFATKFVRVRPYVTTEACTVSTLDYDNDGLAGCADPDCWSRCTPLCPPGATGCPSSPRCGDGTCGPLEDCDLCPGDCGACPAGLCGDYRCNGTETHASCPSDCP